MNSNFRTELKLSKGDFPTISYVSKIFLIGSCFSDEMGYLFNTKKFEVVANPLGISYNPISLCKQLNRILNKSYFSEADIIEKETLYNSYELHGSFDSKNKNDLLLNVNQKIETSHKFLKNASHIFLTLGTSWVYELIENQIIVNNCHKKPSSLFTKKLLSVDSIQKTLLETKELLKNINPNAKIILTISPVRHLKDGFEENNLSKSILRLAIHEVLDDDNYYFPSYEMLMDDLRDYRFYKDDMLHPNKQAVDYIWQKIVDCQMDQNTQSDMKKIDRLMNQFSHRTMNKNSQAAKDFTRSLKDEFTKLQAEMKNLSFSEEIKELEKRLLSSE